MERSPPARALLACLAALAALPLLARDARAADAEDPTARPPEPPPIRGVEVGLRAGYGRSFEASNASALSYATPAAIPLELDLGFRASAAWYVGVAGSLAFTSRTDCGGASPCRAKDYRFELQGQYHARPLRALDPWVGLGLGLESMHLSGFPGDSSGSITRTGVVLADLQLGADVALGQGALRPHVGPFVGLALGETQASDATVRGATSTREIRGDYQWLTLGVRGTVDL